MSDGTAFFENPITDQWIHTELNLSQGEILRKVNVIGRTRDSGGDATGLCDRGAFFNALTCDVEFSYGEITLNNNIIVVFKLG